MLAPTVNAQQAGLAAASSDMNNYAYACQFLLNPPIAWARASNSVAGSDSAQSFTAATATAVLWNTPKADRDQTWLAASPAQFAVNTPGFYEAAGHLNLTNAGVSAIAWIRVTTGTNAPGGSGVTSDWWHASAVSPPSGGGRPFGICSGGLIPQYLYVLDTLQFFVQVNTTCASVVVTGGTFGDWSHKLVSL